MYLHQLKRYDVLKDTRCLSVFILINNFGTLKLVNHLGSFFNYFTTES